MALKVTVYWMNGNPETFEEVLDFGMYPGADYAFKFPYEDNGAKKIMRIPFHAVHHIIATETKDLS